ncbi:hypothetical protein J0H33_07670 [bacterium]|nr:hypothetical protein [bacterium]
MASPRVVVAGNLVLDQADGGAWVPGGPALYAARMAKALGAEVTLVTGRPAGYPAGALRGLDLIERPAEAACRYANTYDAQGNRAQVLLDPGEPLVSETWPGGLIDALIVAPAYHELTALPPVDARVVMVSLQGPLRSVDGDRRVVHAADAVAAATPFIEPGAFASFSDEDVADPEALARHLAARRMTVAVTRGHRGATLFEGGFRREVASLPADPVDPTGAGDCFAAAWAVRFAETGDLGEACAFALAAGALATEKPGLEGVPTRREVEERARHAQSPKGVVA